MDWDGCHAVAGGKRHAHHAVFADREKAEEVRFELTRPLRAYRFSRPAHSATLPLLRASANKSILLSKIGQNRGMRRTMLPSRALARRGLRAMRCDPTWWGGRRR